MITMLLLLLTTAPETIITTAPISSKNTWFWGSWCAGGASMVFSNSRGLNSTVRWVPREYHRRCWCRCWRGVLGRTLTDRRCSSGGEENSSFVSSRTDYGSDIARATIGTIESWSTLKSELTLICVDADNDRRPIRYDHKALFSLVYR